MVSDKKLNISIHFILDLVLLFLFLSFFLIIRIGLSSLTQSICLNEIMHLKLIKPGIIIKSTLSNFEWVHLINSNESMNQTKWKCVISQPPAAVNLHYYLSLIPISSLEPVNKHKYNNEEITIIAISTELIRCPDWYWWVTRHDTKGWTCGEIAIIINHL